MYLDVADSSTLPYGWSRYAQFSLSVVNQIHSKYSVRKGILSATAVLTEQFWFGSVARLDNDAFCPFTTYMSRANGQSFHGLFDYFGPYIVEE